MMNNKFIKEAVKLPFLFTKGGDGFCDLTVLNGMNKRQVRAVEKELGAPKWLWSKEATVIPYDVLDHFLEGKDIDLELERKILEFHLGTANKRSEPVSFFQIRSWAIIIFILFSLKGSICFLLDLTSSKLFLFVIF